MKDYVLAGLRNGPMWTAVISFAVAVVFYARPDIPRGLVLLAAGMVSAVLVAFGVKGLDPIKETARGIKAKRLAPPK